MSDELCANSTQPQGEQSQPTIPASVGLNGQVPHRQEGIQNESRLHNRHEGGLVHRSHRSEGGQPGNQNARKHGFYSKAIPPELRQKLYDASNLKGLDEEITLMRTKIAIAAENCVDYRQLVPGLALLQKMLNANKKLCSNADDNLTNAFALAWAKILPPGIKDPAQAYRLLSDLVKSGAVPASVSEPENVENPQSTEIDCASEPESQGPTTNDSISV